MNIGSYADVSVGVHKLRLFSFQTGTGWCATIFDTGSQSFMYPMVVEDLEHGKQLAAELLRNILSMDIPELNWEPFGYAGASTG